MSSGDAVFSRGADGAVLTNAPLRSCFCTPAAAELLAQPLVVRCFTFDLLSSSLDVYASSLLPRVIKVRRREIRSAK